MSISAEMIGSVEKQNLSSHALWWSVAGAYAIEASARRAVQCVPDVMRENHDNEHESMVVLFREHRESRSQVT